MRWFILTTFLPAPGSQEPLSSLLRDVALLDLSAYLLQTQSSISRKKSFQVPSGVTRTRHNIHG